MNKSFVMAVTILVVLAVVGFSKPSDAYDFKTCLNEWDEKVQGTCAQKEGVTQKEKCLKKWEKWYKKCYKNADDLTKKMRDAIRKCSMKYELDVQEYKSKSKKDIKKAAKGYAKGAMRCGKKFGLDL